jgi:hypothetical protein
VLTEETDVEQLFDDMDSSLVQSDFEDPGPSGVDASLSASDELPSGIGAGRLVDPLSTLGT